MRRGGGESPESGRQASAQRHAERIGVKVAAVGILPRRRLHLYVRDHGPARLHTVRGSGSGVTRPPLQGPPAASGITLPRGSATPDDQDNVRRAGATRRGAGRVSDTSAPRISILGQSEQPVGASTLLQGTRATSGLISPRNLAALKDEGRAATMPSRHGHVQRHHPEHLHMAQIIRRTPAPVPLAAHARPCHAHPTPTCRPP